MNAFRWYISKDSEIWSIDYLRTTFKNSEISFWINLSSVTQISKIEIDRYQIYTTGHTRALLSL